jgi:hypothetical protein
MILLYSWMNHLCGRAVGVPGYRSRGLGSIPGATRICEKVVRLSLMSTVEELLERKSRGSCLETQKYGRRDPSR